jgi:hypothetical protein
MVEEAMFVTTLHGDVLVTVQRGDSVADEHLSAYSTMTGETLGTRHLGERDDLRCAPSVAGQVWCVSREEPIALYTMPAVGVVAETLKIRDQNPMMPPLDRAAPSWIDAATGALVVQTEGGARFAIDPRTLGAARYAGDAAAMTRIGERPQGCDSGIVARLGAVDLELRGDEHPVLFRDGSPVQPAASFYQARFLSGADCQAVSLDGPASAIVADEGSSGGGGAFVRVGADGAVVWRSPPFDSPYTVFPGKREGDRLVVAMPHEIAALGATDGRVVWHRSF